MDIRVGWSLLGDATSCRGERGCGLLKYDESSESELYDGERGCVFDDDKRRRFLFGYSVGGERLL